ncbi:MAG: YfhO family protein, partial [bacterium]
VAPFMPGRVRQGSTESVTFDSYSPQRVEITATLEKPGMVILADVFYNGWMLEVDGKPAEIIRANRMMRGALLPSGTHKLVYTYDPPSFRMGGRLSIASGLILVAMAFFTKKPKK